MFTLHSTKSHTWAHLSAVLCTIGTHVVHRIRRTYAACRRYAALRESPLKQLRYARCVCRYATIRRRDGGCQQCRPEGGFVFLRRCSQTRTFVGLLPLQLSLWNKKAGYTVRSNYKKQKQKETRVIIFIIIVVLAAQHGPMQSGRLRMGGYRLVGYPRVSQHQNGPGTTRKGLLVERL